MAALNRPSILPTQSLNFAEVIVSQCEAKLSLEFHITPVAAIDRFTDSVLYRLEGTDPKLGQCDYPHTSCSEKATIHHLADEAEYCARHYREMIP